MQLTRRGLFAALPGAAAAAPDLAREAADAMTYGTRGLLTGETLSNKLDPTWTLQQVEKAKRIAAGNILPEDMANEPIPGRYIEERSELKSLSMRGREVLNSIAHDRRQRERMIEAAKQALAEYDKTGFLRHLW